MSKTRTIATIAALLSLTAGCTTLKRCAYEGFGRDRWQHPQQVIESLEIEPGARIADLGAGTGYFTFRLADATGSKGMVYAVDVDEGLIDYLGERARKDGYGNVDPILAEPDDPRLPEDGVDLIFTCNTYHHLENRTQYFRNVAQYLRPGGRLAIIEYRRKGFFQRLFDHATPRDTIVDEIEAAGYELEREPAFLSNQAFLIFARADR